MHEFFLQSFVASTNCVIFTVDETATQTQIVLTQGGVPFFLGDDLPSETVTPDKVTLTELCGKICVLPQM